MRSQTSSWYDELVTTYGHLGAAAIGWWKTLDCRFLTPPPVVEDVCRQIAPVVAASAGMHPDAARRAVAYSAAGAGAPSPERLAAWIV